MHIKYELFDTCAVHVKFYNLLYFNLQIDCSIRVYIINDESLK